MLISTILCFYFFISSTSQKNDSKTSEVIISGIVAKKRATNDEHISNARVTLTHRNGSLIRSVATDVSGTYQFKVIPGNYYLQVSAEKVFVPVTAEPLKTEINITQNENVKKDFFYKSVFGKVKKFKTKEKKLKGVPLSGIEVGFINKKSGLLTSTTTTNEKGEFQIFLPLGVYKVNVFLPPGLTTIEKEKNTTINMLSEDVFDNLQFNVTVAPGHPGSITGVIFIDREKTLNPQQGNGVLRANVSVYDQDLELVKNVQTNKLGEFRIPIEPGDYLVEISVPGNKTLIDGNGQYKVSIESGKNVDLEIPVESSSNDKLISGKVFLDSNNNGVFNSEKVLSQMNVIIKNQQNENVIKNVTTDNQGNYQVLSLPPGLYTIFVEDRSIPKELKRRKSAWSDDLGRVGFKIPQPENKLLKINLPLIVREGNSSIPQTQNGVCRFCSKHAECIGDVCRCLNGFKGDGFDCEKTF